MKLESESRFNSPRVNESSLYSVYLRHNTLPWAVAFLTNASEVVECIKNIFFHFVCTDQTVVSLICEIHKNQNTFTINIPKRHPFQTKKVQVVCGYIAHIVFLPDYLRQDEILFLHGAALMNKISGKVAAFIAKTGGGKTTLTASLLASGEWSYLSDDIVAVEKKRLAVHAWPKGLYVRNEKLIQAIDPQEAFFLKAFISLEFDGECKELYVPQIVTPGVIGTLSHIYFLNRASCYSAISFTKLQPKQSWGMLMKNLRDPIGISEAASVLASLIAKIPCSLINYSECAELVNYMREEDKQ